ncbi:MAG: hypothetical protein AAFZ15_26285 [Bacteroidota bacterium]
MTKRILIGKGRIIGGFAGHFANNKERLRGLSDETRRDREGRRELVGMTLRPLWSVSACFVILSSLTTTGGSVLQLND